MAVQTNSGIHWLEKTDLNRHVYGDYVVRQNKHLKDDVVTLISSFDVIVLSNNGSKHKRQVLIESFKKVNLQSKLFATINMLHIMFGKDSEQHFVVLKCP